MKNDPRSAVLRTSPRGLVPSRVFLRYAIYVSALVTAALAISGAVQLLVSYRENQEALGRIQQEQATAAAATVQQFTRDIEQQLFWTTGLVQPIGDAGIQQLRADYLRAMRQASAIAEISHLNSVGEEQIRLSRLAIASIGSGRDRSAEPAFLGANSGGTFFGPLYFRGDAEPYMTVSLAGTGPQAGVTVAEVNLKLVWDEISRIKVGTAGHAYAVDSSGLLLAHPDISLVLRKTDLSSLAQVRDALTAGRGPGSAVSSVASDLLGRPTLTTYARIESLGWLVFVEQPLDEAFAPLYSLVARTLALLVFGLAIALLASFILARRLVAPIQAIQIGAARIGEGALDHRIDVRTGDELEELADEFNHMASRLQDTYATLEQRVQERTHELAAAIEELEETGNKLQAASRHKSEFLAHMSHELRTPLNAVIGFSEILADRMVGDLNPKQEEFVGDILDSGRHLLSVLNDILDLTRVEAGRMELSLAVFALPQTLEHSLTIIRERATAQGVALGLSVGSNIGLIEADERKVTQILFNLLSNAVKFTSSGGRIDISAQLADNEVVIAVRDTGAGIAAEDQERIFGEFEQAGPTVLGAREGTGLGLALSKRFVELHGGRIWVESQPGVGSVFTFSLPLQPRTHSAQTLGNSREVDSDVGHSVDRSEVPGG